MSNNDEIEPDFFGGELLDQGMYGCIFKPTLVCKDGTTRRHPSQVKQAAQVTQEPSSINPPLTKLTLKEDAEIEFQLSAIIQKIPLWKNYFSVSESICEPAVKQSEKNLASCDVLGRHTWSDFLMLSMAYAGVPLNTYRFDLARLDFMKFATHLIEAGALLTLFGIVHRDLHPGNILVDTATVPRIIDFNLAIRVDSSVAAADLSHKHSLGISQEPPDSTLVNGIAQNMNGQHIIESIVLKKPVIKKMQTVLGFNQQDLLRQLNTFYGKSKSMRNGDLAAWFQQYWRTIDSWAIGTNIVDLILKLSIWPEFTPILNKHKAKLYPLLKRMCAVVPTDRVDCVQALHYLDPNHFILRKYGKAWIAKVGDGSIM